MTEQTPAPLGWWTISGEGLLDALRRVHAGEGPDAVYAELYVNAETDTVEAITPEIDHGEVVLRVRGYSSGHVRIETSHLTREETLDALATATRNVGGYPGEWTTDHRDLT